MTTLNVSFVILNMRGRAVCSNFRHMLIRSCNPLQGGGSGKKSPIYVFYERFLTVFKFASRSIVHDDFEGDGNLVRAIVFDQLEA